ncbi:MAG: hypothetical protein LUD52_04560 [Opitutae bacterium]|nr:hypothetical protein [Opitutae bacterium]
MSLGKVVHAGSQFKLKTPFSAGTRINKDKNFVAEKNIAKNGGILARAQKKLAVPVRNFREWCG